jgi:hypothetical protein
MYSPLENTTIILLSICLHINFLMFEKELYTFININMVQIYIIVNRNIQKKAHTNQMHIYLYRILIFIFTIGIFTMKTE